MNTIQRDSIISFPFLNLSMNPPASFEVFGITIYFYGVIIGVAFLLGILYAAKHSKYVGLTEDNVYDAVIWMIPMSLIGARLYFVLFQLDYYIAHPNEIVAVWEGGLAIYGGIILGVITVWIVCKKKHVKPLAMIDLLIVACILGQAIGRWGNFMNREAFGAETEVFCAMGLTDPLGNTIYVHPTFLYESLWNFIGFIILNAFLKSGKRKFDGQILLMYCVWYGFGRFFIEGLRTDSLYLGSIRISQLLSLVLVIAGIILLILIGRKKKCLTTETSSQEQ